MFKFLVARKLRRVNAAVDLPQLQLDNLRYHNAGNQMMQLHLDRMQTALDASRA